MQDRNKIELQIANNRLLGLEYDFVIAQLCVLNNKPYEDMKIELDNLIDAGKYIVNNNLLESNNDFLEKSQKGIKSKKEKRRNSNEYALRRRTGIRPIFEQRRSRCFCPSNAPTRKGIGAC